MCKELEQVIEILESRKQNYVQPILRDISNEIGEDVAKLLERIVMLLTEKIEGRNGHQEKIVTKEGLEILLERGFTIAEIAKVYGLSRQRVHQKMTEYGITLEKVREKIENRIVYLYSVEKWSIESLSKMFKIGESSIRRILKEKGEIKKRISPLVREKIEILYNEGKTIKEIADLFGLSITSVRKVVDTSKRMKRVDISKEELEKLLDKGLTYKEIAKLYNCTPLTIYNKRKKFGLKKRGSRKYTEEFIKKVEEEIKKGIPVNQVAKLHNIPPFSLYNLLYRNKIKVKGIRGEGKKIYTDELIQEVVKRIEKGETLFEIAKDLKVNKNSLSTILYKKGFRVKDIRKKRRE